MERVLDQLGILETPVYVLDEEAIAEGVGRAGVLREEVGLKVLFSVSALPYVDLLTEISHLIDGFATSSLFEAKLARRVLGKEGFVQTFFPGLREAQIGLYQEQSDQIILNSLSQWERTKPSLIKKGRAGLRVNPKVSFVSDPRLDPCGLRSKLGTPIEELEEAIATEPELLEGLGGIAIEVIQDTNDFGPLWPTVMLLERRLGPWLHRLRWINLGGGFRLEDIQNVDALVEAVEHLRWKFGLEVFFEVGAPVVREAGFLVATVIDLFTSDDIDVAVLDTTLSHLPQTFSGIRQPEVLGHDEDGTNVYSLVGSSASPTDVFGVFNFNEPLELGSKIVFVEVEPSSIVMAGYDQGINIPRVYNLTRDNRLVSRVHFDDRDYLRRCGES